MYPCYQKIPEKSTIVPELLALAEKGEWQDYIYWKAIPVSDELINKDPFLSKLRETRTFRAGILLTPPNSCYKWHVDTYRSVGVNLLIKHKDSHSVFTFDEENINVPVHELKYEEDTYYIYNTKVPHMVLNVDEPRYIMTLEFIGKDSNLEFDELREEIDAIYSAKG